MKKRLCRCTYAPCYTRNLEVRTDAAHCVGCDHTLTDVANNNPFAFDDLLGAFGMRP